MLIAAFSLLVLLTAAGLAAGGLTRKLGFMPGSDRLERAIAWGTVFVAWCLASVLLPATAAELTGLGLVRLSIVAALASMGAVVLRAVPVGGCGLRPERQPARRRRRLPGFVWLALAPVVALHAGLLLDALLRPPASFDGLFYHLPLAVRWLREARLLLPVEVYEFCLSGNWNVWQMLVLALGQGWLVEASLMPIGLLLALIVVGLARQTGATAAGAALSAAFVLATPMVARQMYSSYTDLFGTTFLAAALFWTVCFARRERDAAARPVYAGLAGLSAGMALGTKLTFIPWVGIVVLLIAYAGLRGLRRVDSVLIWRNAARSVAVFVLALMVCSGFWFFRATYHTGNPLYPIRLRPANVELGRGRPVSQAASWTPVTGLASLAYPWFEWKGRGYAYGVDNGLGPHFATFAVLGTIYAFLRGRRTIGAADRRAERLLLAFVVMGLVVFLGPARSYARYALPLWVVMLVPAGRFAELLGRTAPRLSIPLLGATVALSAAMTGLWPARSLAGRLRDGDLSRSYAYGLPALFDDLRPGTVILNLGPPATNYPLLGRHLSNHVIENTAAKAWGLTPPLQREQLGRYGVEFVYTRGSDPPPFAADVVFETAFDDSEDPARRITTVPTRVYHVLGNRSDRHVSVAHRKRH